MEKIRLALYASKIVSYAQVRLRDKIVYVAYQNLRGVLTNQRIFTGFYASKRGCRKLQMETELRRYRTDVARWLYHQICLFGKNQVKFKIITYHFHFLMISFNYREAFDKDPELANLLLDEFFRDAIHRCQSAWRDVIAKAVESGIPTPAFSTALAFYDGYRAQRSPANLIQVFIITQ